MKHFLIIILIFFMLQLCISCVASNQPPTATPIPDFPYELPRYGIGKDHAAVWEYPGLPPTDKNSDFTGYTGEYRGELSSEDLEIIEYEWSETDQTYYVLVRQGEVEGWVDFNFIQVIE
ncbi:MAG: hypothetical protein ACK5NN_04265 [Sphingomonadaceae bacterium]